MIIKNLYILLFSLLLFACVKDKPNPDVQTVPLNNNRKIVVLNEGSFNNYNAEVSIIDLENNSTTNNVFKNVNQQILGDVAQHISIINNQYYITINNSNKIVVLDTNFQLTSEINNILFPRYITQISKEKAYVSCMYFPYVFVLNLQTNSISDTIQTDFANTENILVVNNEVWICNWDTACNYIYIVDKFSNEIKEKISINGYAPHNILQDKNGMIWVLSGNKYKNKSSYLTQINPINKTILKKFVFSANDDPIKISFNNSKDELYYINVNYNGQSTNNGLYKIKIDDINLPNNPLISAPKNTYFWAIAIDPITSNILLSDPKGFTQNSTIYQYNEEGKLLQTFQTGIGSNQFLF